MKMKMRSQKSEVRIKRRGRKPLLARFFQYFLILASLFLLLSSAYGKVYIDITAPAPKKMPIAIFDLVGPSGREISDIIREDLIFTGLFQAVDKTSFIESPAQAFNPQNWTPLGIEAVVKGNVSEEKNLSITIALYDTFEGREILNKQYQSEKELLRQLSHSISNDVYAAMTGRPGIFRTRIAFIGEEGEEKGIYIMDWDGHRIRKLGLKGSLVLAPHWSQDGSRIIYSSERGRQWGIYLLDFLKMTEKRVFASKGTNMAGDFFPKSDSFIFSSSKDGTPDLYTFNINDNSVKKITSTHGIEVSPAVSSDGKTVAFVSDRGGSPQIYLMQPDGTEIRRVTFEGSYNTSPHWSPAGDRLVFSGRRGGKNQIFTVKSDGSELMQLTDHGNNEDPSFSSDGRYIVFSSDREKTKAIYIMRANGEAQKKISPKDLKAFGPRWSPN
ncbi:MAG: Tol-Pal system beta propeller repeat protein TolB [Nitrospirae bacterium]|nr:Tol-Pal system beta propeller repeat protein TolB [Nitrospirota bacterium]